MMNFVIFVECREVMVNFMGPEKEKIFDHNDEK